MRPKLTPALQETICAFVRSGGFPHVAAEAAGVPKDLFHAWHQRGANPKCRGGYRTFYLAVEQAKAQARMAAEIKALQENPIAWLRFGPGRERADNPGWTTPPKPQLTQDNRAINVLLSPEMNGFFAALLQILSPYPEARVAVAQALAGKGALPLSGPKSDG